MTEQAHSFSFIRLYKNENTQQTALTIQILERNVYGLIIQKNM